MELLSYAPQFAELGWPATRGELIRFAAGGWVPLHVLGELFQLPDDDTAYPDMVAVLEALGVNQLRRQQPPPGFGARRS